jgi:hypothetical protein
MEKQPHQEYRDELADKLKEIRNSDEENPEIVKAKAQGYLDAKKETEEYTEAEINHKLENQSREKNEEIAKMVCDEINDFVIQGKKEENHWKNFLDTIVEYGAEIKNEGENGSTLSILFKGFNDENIENLFRDKSGYRSWVYYLDKIESLKSIKSVKIMSGNPRNPNTIHTFDGANPVGRVSGTRNSGAYILRSYPGGEWLLCHEKKGKLS